MSRASTLSGFTTAIGSPTNLNVGILTATSVNTTGSYSFSDLDITGTLTAEVGVKVGPTSGIGITLNANGSAAFVGNIQQGDALNTSTTTGGFYINDGYIRADLPSGANTDVYSVRAGGTENIRLTANGTSRFTSSVQVGPTAGIGITLNANGNITAAGAIEVSIPNGANAVWGGKVGSTLNSQILGDGSAYFGGNSGGANITLNADGSASFAASLVVNGNNYPTAGALGNRNYVGNGTFQVDQRNNGSAVTPGGSQTYTLDRWRVINPTGISPSPYSVQQVSTDLPTGFNYGTKITVDNVTAVTTNNQFFYGTNFEAYDLGYWEYGTSNALTATLSFYVRSSVTGTYCISLTNDANTRSFVSEYTISSANTWEYKTIVIPGDTTGTWPSTGSVRHSFLQFDLGAGSSFYGTNGSWVNGNKRKTSGSVNFVSQAVGSTFMVTGVQLELGTKATPFEHRRYGEDLSMCQRYYYKDPTSWYQSALIDGNGTIVAVFVRFPVEMRALPTISHLAIGSFYWNPSGSGNSNVTPNGTGSYWGGNVMVGLANLPGCNNLGGSNNDQMSGQFKTQIEYSAEL